MKVTTDEFSTTNQSVSKQVHAFAQAPKLDVPPKHDINHEISY